MERWRGLGYRIGCVKGMKKYEGVGGRGCLALLKSMGKNKRSLFQHTCPNFFFSCSDLVRVISFFPLAEAANSWRRL